MALPENLLAPISAESPCGPPPGGDWHDKLRELRKPNEAAVEAFLAPKTDKSPRIMTRDIWAPRDLRKLVDGLCGAIATKSKDLEMAAWLTEALGWRDGFAGLNDGLRLMLDLLGTYWDQLHPLPDEDGDPYRRAALLERVGMSESMKDSCVAMTLGFVTVTQSGLTLNQYNASRTVPTKKEADDSEEARTRRREETAAGKPSPEDFEAALTATPKAFYKRLKADATACREALDALDAACRERFTIGDPPGFTRLKTLLEQAENAAAVLLRKKLDADPDPVETPAADAAASPAPDAAAEPALASAGEAGTASDAAAAAVSASVEPSGKQDAFARVALVARYLRKLDPNNPVPYLLLRSLRWGELYGAGDKIPESLLLAPPSTVRAKIKALAAAGEWAQVLDLAETSMAAEYGRAWLDLQRYSFRACESLGYDKAARAISSAVKQLTRDFPKIHQAILDDDTGAANSETAKWLVANNSD